MPAIAPRVVGITEVRNDATNLIAYTQRQHEPVLICVRSKKAAYIVSAADYEAMYAELRRLRHERFVRGVAEAEEEDRRGESRAFTNVEDLIADLGLED